jgi:hypothetical protein
MIHFPDTPKGFCQRRPLCQFRMTETIDARFFGCSLKLKKPQEARYACACRNQIRTYS